jgi:hypothetical protein
MKGAYMVVASSDKTQHVFLAKLKEKAGGSPHKSKVKKADSVISLIHK